MDLVDARDLLYTVQDTELRLPDVTAQIEQWTGGRELTFTPSCEKQLIMRQCADYLLGRIQDDSDSSSDDEEDDSDNDDDNDDDDDEDDF
jgi:hypothetical protein